MSLPHTIFAAVLVVVGAALAWMQWSDTANESSDEAEREYQAQKFSRRLWIASLVTLVGAAIFAGQFIASPGWLGIYWMLVLCVGVAIGVLGVLDYRATQGDIEREMKELLEDRSRFAKEIAREEKERKLREERSSNGAH